MTDIKGDAFSLSQAHYQAHGLQDNKVLQWIGNEVRMQDKVRKEEARMRRGVPGRFNARTKTKVILDGRCKTACDHQDAANIRWSTVTFALP